MDEVQPESRILIIDDDRRLARMCQYTLEAVGYDVTCAFLGLEGCELIQENSFDLVLTDLRLPDRDGLEVLRHTKTHSPDSSVIVFTGFPTIQTAVEAIKQGAFDYLKKPFETPHLLTLIDRAIEYKRMLEENRELRVRLEEKMLGADLVGNSQVMHGFFALIRRVAPSRSNVLLVGESGTGKELIARRIHDLRPIQSGPFIPIDCAALPEQLLESELFGHAQGAFTGALREKAGLIEMAEGGTLFLDEIGELPLGLQAKLLRALQEKRIRRVGGREWQSIDFRLIAATNRDLKVRVSRGAFREDLYFRLNVLLLKVPPLREREGDIPLLAMHFLQRTVGSRQSQVLGFTREALAFLENREWAGNVRELRNLVERSVYLSTKGYLGPEDLELESQKTSVEPAELQRNEFLPYAEAKEKALREFELRYLTEILSRYDGNVSAAAREADVSRTTLQKLLTRQRLESRHFRDPV